MRIVNRKSAVALALALALGIGAGAVRAGDTDNDGDNNDNVIQAYANGNQVSVLVESVLDPTSQEYQQVVASDIANTVYIIFGNGQAIDHVLDIPAGPPTNGDTYNPYWNFTAVVFPKGVPTLRSASDINDYLDVAVAVIPLVTYNEAYDNGIDLGYYTDDVAYVLCPEVYLAPAPSP